MNIPFYQTYTSIESADRVRFLIDNPAEIAKRIFTKQCTKYFENEYPGYKALLVSSCTRALDLIAMSLDLGPNDEVIMPSFNYVGVANAFALTGVNLVFADIDSETMNLSLASIKACISSKTRAVIVMNYAGIGKELEAISEFCKEKELTFIEDNAQGINSYYKSQLLGSFGDISCISFDSLKNISCGEGGVILYKERFEESIQKVFNNGTNRLAFERGDVPAYEWVRQGSKFVISEYNAAILWPLLENGKSIIKERKAKWDLLYNQLWEYKELRFCLPAHMKNKSHNAHIFYLKFEDNEQRNKVMNYMQEKGVSCSFHYTPLHSSIMGAEKKYRMPINDFTSSESGKLLRLPMYNELSLNQTGVIAETLSQAVLACKSEPLSAQQ